MGQSWVLTSGFSNAAFTDAEAARRAAGSAMQKACEDLAAVLRAATDAYEVTDQQTGADLDSQVLPK